MLKVGDWVKVVYRTHGDDPHFGLIGQVVKMPQLDGAFITIEYEDGDTGRWTLESSLEKIEGEYERAVKVLGADYFYG